MLESIIWHQYLPDISSNPPPLYHTLLVTHKSLGQTLVSCANKREDGNWTRYDCSLGGIYLIHNDDVLAWAHLPKPYKKDGDN